ncbi:MAG: nucleotidyltransferase domain-containing protein [bacterium]
MNPSDPNEPSLRNPGSRVAGWLSDLLGELRSGLEGLYGEHLKGLYLFGSHARGDAGPDSDVDVLVVLDEIGSYYGELDRSAELVSSLSLRYDVSISRVFLPIAEWNRSEGPFLLTVREDAVAA